jgi:hypothetical protein
VILSVAAARPHTDAVVAVLAVAGLKVGRGGKPDDAGWQGQEGDSTHVPYAVVYPSPGSTDGGVAEPYEYLDYTVQINCVGATQDAAEAVADLCKAALVGRRLPVEGRSSYPGVLELDRRPASRDDTVLPSSHMSVLQISWRTQPA